MQLRNLLNPIILAVLCAMLANPVRVVGAVSGIYLDGKGKSHALEEPVTNPFAKNSKDGKTFEVFLDELNKYKRCPVVYSGNGGLSAADLEKKLDKDIQDEDEAQKTRKKAIDDANSDYETAKKKADKDEENERREDEKKERDELDNAPNKDAKEGIKKTHKENRQAIRKKYRNDQKTGIIDQLEKTKTDAIKAAKAKAAAPLNVTCGASDACGDKPCKTKYLGLDPGDEKKTKGFDVPGTLGGLGQAHLLFCTCGKK